MVVSRGVLRALDQPIPAAPFMLRLSGGRVEEYAELWRTRPAVRTVVEFLARNIASLGLHVFRRVSDTDRERLTDHPLARLIFRPNPVTTQYRLLHALVSDLAIFDVASGSSSAPPDQPGIVRLPPERVTPDGGQLAGARVARGARAAWPGEVERGSGGALPAVPATSPHEAAVSLYLGNHKAYRGPDPRHHAVAQAAALARETRVS